jgi:F-box-like
MTNEVKVIETTVILVNFSSLICYQFSDDHPAPKKQKIDESGDKHVVLTRKQASLMKIYNPTAPSPFSKLPNEVVENIFVFLDRESLLKSVLVNKRWSKVIGSSAKAMKKITLSVNLAEGVENIELKKLERNYQVMKFKGSDKKLPKNIIDALKKIGANVKKIEYNGGTGLIFFDVLKCFPNIESISIDKCWFLDVSDDYKPPELPKLKIMKASFCENVSLEHFAFQHKF